MYSPQQQTIAQPASTNMVRPLPYLPTELKLQIIKDAITFPDGLRSDHWHDNQQDLVNKLSLLGHEMSALVLDSLHKVNKVVIKPQLKRPDSRTIDGPELESYGYLAPFHCSAPSNIRPYITYPTIAQSASVKELEFHLDVVSADYYPTYYISDQFAWLRKLASGELGFPALEALRIVLDLDYGLGRKGALNILEQIRQWNGVPFHFATADLAIVINRHSCSCGACIHESEVRSGADHDFECKIQGDLQNMLRAHDQQQS